MGFSAAAAAFVGAMAYGAREQRKARQEEERQTGLERERLEAMQAQIAAQDAATQMPDPLAQRRARRRSITEQMRRRGRASTILTGDSTIGDPLGG